MNLYIAHVKRNVLRLQNMLHIIQPQEVLGIAVLLFYCRRKIVGLIYDCWFSVHFNPTNYEKFSAPEVLGG